MQSRWTLFSVLIRATPLLPHFVRHYSALGFTDWVVAVHSACAPVDWDALGAVSSMRIHRVPCYRWTPKGMRDTQLINGLRAMHIGSSDEWHAVADIDEFHEYPLPLKELAETAKLSNCVAGEFVDRLAADGSLASIRDDIPISEQFPVRSRLSHILLRSVCRKIILCREEQSLSGGHHKMFNERIFGVQGFVHHYKWNSDAIDHMALEGPSARDKLPGYIRSVRTFLDYIKQHGCIRVNDFTKPPKYRLKFIMKDGRKLYPGAGKDYRFVDESDAASISSIVDRGAYDSMLTTLVMDATDPKAIKIARAVLEPIKAPIDAEALGPLIRPTRKAS
jgi:hypothetical protein